MRFTQITNTIANGFVRSGVAGVEMLRTLLDPMQQASHTVQQILDRMWLTRLYPRFSLAGFTGDGYRILSGNLTAPGFQPDYGDPARRLFSEPNPGKPIVAGQSPRGFASHVRFTGITRCQSFLKAHSGRS